MAPFHFNRENMSSSSKAIDTISPQSPTNADVQSPTDSAQVQLFTASTLSPQNTSHSILDVSPEEFHLIESNISSHKYLFRRPRALQYTYQSRLVHHGEDEGHKMKSSQHKTQDLLHNHSRPHAHAHVKHDERESIAKNRERLDLFIDLIWVGIIGNLSEVYSDLYFRPDGNHGQAILVFMIAFLPTWRIWNLLREFLNNYYMDDIFQRLFVFWILALSVLYGNNLAYLTDDLDNIKATVITVFLIIRSSFVIMEAIYSIWIPWLRLQMSVRSLLYLPGTGLWIAAIFINGIIAVGPIAAALTWEYAMPWVQETRLMDRLTPNGYGKATDSHHYASRMQNFFIITVGEGVLSLIRFGPLGAGLQSSAGTSVWSLVNYFLLVLLYFNRDYSKTYLSAVRHKGWRTMLWASGHVTIFSCFVLLSAATTFILRNHSTFPENSSSEDTTSLTPDQIHAYTRDSIWTIASSLSIILFSITFISLLDQPLDPPGTLVLNNRYLRMAGRPIYIGVTLGIASLDNVDHFVFLTITGALLVTMCMFEWIASLERGGGLIEPKGLAGLLKAEIVPGRLGRHGEQAERIEMKKMERSQEIRS